MLSLKKIKPPMLEIEMPDGTICKYDAFDMIRRVAGTLDGNVGYLEVINLIRQAFELPAEVTDYMVLLILKELVRLVEESADVKGLLPVPQN
jgi:hypothetical protein